MLTFVSSWSLVSWSKSPFARTTCIPRRNVSRIMLSTRRQARTLSPSCSVEASASRKEALKHGIDAAVEDYAKSGLNICICGGKREDVTKLVDALDSLNQVEGLVDVAFVSTSPATKVMLDERDMPTDLGVNFKPGIDVFFAIVSAMDEDCNAVLDSDNIAGDKYAAHIAEKVVLIVHENDVEDCKYGLRSVPVQMVTFLPKLAAESLCSGSLVDFGVRGATLREDGSSIADLSLAPHMQPQALEHELCRLPQVVASGMLPATEKTIAVIATRDLQPVDMTSSLYSMASLSEESRTVALTDQKRNEMLGKYAKDWTVVDSEDGEILSREFKFMNVESAKAFVRYVHYISSGVRCCPEIKHANTQVEVSLKTEGATGITELDTLVSKELASVYDRMFSSAQMMF